MNTTFVQQGVGAVIAGGRLRVPLHQREYSWETEHVMDLCNDLNLGLRENKQWYFLGTVVLTTTEDFLEVVDGQQRLATTTIILSTLRDILYRKKENQMVTYIQNRFLFDIDPQTEQPISKLALNVKDQEFFLRRVIKTPDDPERLNSGGNCPSNLRLSEAATTVRTFFEQLLTPIPEPSRKDLLKSWIAFIENKAQLIVARVPNNENAYTMFETLNDRGLKVSQADLVKNYIFGRAGDKLPEVQHKWAAMIATLESLGLEDSAIDYLRFLCSLLYGLTRGHEVFDKIKNHVTSQQSAVQFVYQLDQFAHDYVAMLSPDHSKWNDYPAAIRRSLRTLNRFDATQIRHLMLAVSHHFGKQEAAKAFNLFVNWLVRLFIAGVGRIGRVESTYAALANTIHNTREITTADALAEKMSPFIAKDHEFKQAFATARVSQAKLARYYLDSMERKMTGAEDAGLVPNDDTSEVNLEHIIPLNSSKNWGHLDSEMAQSLYNRIGNLVLLNAKKNSKIGDFGFDEKLEVLKNSPFVLTSAVAKFKKWGEAEVNERQLELAEIAVKTWPLRLP